MDERVGDGMTLPGDRRSVTLASRRRVRRSRSVSIAALVATATTALAAVHVSTPVAAPLAGGSIAAFGMSDAAGRCSLAEANAVAERLHLNDGLVVAKPVNRVLCGSFVGPGSNAMVASLTRETCLPSLGWAVFRFAGGDWQLVMKRNGFATLSKVGSDIREEVPVFRSGDSPCNPTGRTKSRSWHWNGSRFVAGVWNEDGKGTSNMAAFFTPSRNLFCTIGDHGGSRGAVMCSSSKPEHTVALGLDGRLDICRGAGCIGNPGINDPQPTPKLLAYGRQITLGRFRCRSEAIGVTCVVVRSGKGFRINRDGVRRVGP